MLSLATREDEKVCPLCVPLTIKHVSTDYPKVHLSPRGQTPAALAGDHEIAPRRFIPASIFVSQDVEAPASVAPQPP
eukprot:4155233-Amphidinium_carterae.2